MNRRGFLASCLALGAAPAIVRADALMRIVPGDTIIEELTYAERDFRWYSGYESMTVVTPPPNASEIIATVLRARQAQFAANVMRGNLLLQEMRRRGVWQ